jgi:hypothetical protein
MSGDGGVLLNEAQLVGLLPWMCESEGRPWNYHLYHLHFMVLLKDCKCDN